MPIRWNKLVRDRIPEIIATEGGLAVTSVLTTDEYREALRAKLVEECNELANADPAELASEAADVIEVVMTYCRLHGVTEDDISTTRQDKLLRRGGFERRILLIETQ